MKRRPFNILISILCLLLFATDFSAKVFPGLDFFQSLSGMEPDLYADLSSDDDEIVAEALWRLGSRQVYSQRIERRLLAFSNHGNIKILRLALWAMGSNAKYVIAKDYMADRLHWVCQHHNPDIRATALWTLSHVNPDFAKLESLLLDFSNNQQGQTRLAAFQVLNDFLRRISLSKKEYNRVISMLRKGLSDEYLPVRRMTILAYMAILKHGQRLDFKQHEKISQDMLPQLMEQDKDIIFASAEILSLLTLSDKLSLEIIIRLLYHESEQVNKLAIDMIKRTGFDRGSRFNILEARLLSDSHDGQKKSNQLKAIVAIGSLGRLLKDSAIVSGDSFLLSMIKMLHESSDSLVKMNCAWAIGQFGFLAAKYRLALQKMIISEPDLVILESLAFKPIAKADDYAQKKWQNIVTSALDSDKPYLRYSALRQISIQPDSFDDYVAHIMGSLRSDDAFVVDAALDFIIARSKPNGILAPLLISLLDGYEARFQYFFSSYNTEEKNDKISKYGKKIVKALTIAQPDAGNLLDDINSLWRDSKKSSHRMASQRLSKLALYQSHQGYQKQIISTLSTKMAGSQQAQEQALSVLLSIASDDVLLIYEMLPALLNIANSNLPMPKSSSRRDEDFYQRNFSQNQQLAVSSLELLAEYVPRINVKKQKQFTQKYFQIILQILHKALLIENETLSKLALHIQANLRIVWPNFSRSVWEIWPKRSAEWRAKAIVALAGQKKDKDMFAKNMPSWLQSKDLPIAKAALHAWSIQESPMFWPTMPYHRLYTSYDQRGFSEKEVTELKEELLLVIRNILRKNTKNRKSGGGNGSDDFIGYSGHNGQSGLEAIISPKSDLVLIKKIPQDILDSYHQVLQMALSSQDDRLKQGALFALADNGAIAGQLLPQLCAVLKTSSAQTRRTAWLLLAKHGLGDRCFVQQANLQLAEPDWKLSKSIHNYILSSTEAWQAQIREKLQEAILRQDNYLKRLVLSAKDSHQAMSDKERQIKSYRKLFGSQNHAMHFYGLLVRDEHWQMRYQAALGLEHFWQANGKNISGEDRQKLKNYLQAMTLDSNRAVRGVSWRLWLKMDQNQAIESAKKGLKVSDHWVGREILIAFLLDKEPAYLANLYSGYDRKTTVRKNLIADKSGKDFSQSLFRVLATRRDGYNDGNNDSLLERKRNLLLQGLSDDSWYNRYLSIRGLSKGLLQSNISNGQLLTAQILRKEGLVEQEALVRSSLLQSLFDIGIYAQDRLFWRQMLEHKHDGLRLQTVANIQDCEQAKKMPAEAIQNLLFDASPTIRGHAARLVGCLGRAKRSVMVQIRHLIVNGSNEQRANALQSFGLIADPNQQNFQFLIDYQSSLLEEHRQIWAVDIAQALSQLAPSIQHARWLFEELLSLFETNVHRKDLSPALRILYQRYPALAEDYKLCYKSKDELGNSTRIACLHSLASEQGSLSSDRSVSNNKLAFWRSVLEESNGDDEVLLLEAFNHLEGGFIWQQKDQQWAWRRMITLLNHKNSDIRAYAYQNLAKLQQHGIKQVPKENVLMGLADKYWLIRYWSLALLGHCGLEARQVSSVLLWFEQSDPSASVRQRAQRLRKR